MRGSATDVAETDDLSRQQPGVVAELEERMRAAYRPRRLQLVGAGPAGDGDDLPTEETREQLRSLGYLED